MSDFVKYQKMFDLNVFMDNVFSSIKRENAEFGDVLFKWKFLIHKTVRKISKVSGRDEIEVFQDLMVSLSKIASNKKLKLYRWRKNIYEVDQVDGFYTRLLPNRYNLNGGSAVWVRTELLKPVKQAKLSSLVYTKIGQQESVLLRRVFTQKNGYQVISKSKEMTKINNGSYGEKFREIEKKKVAKVNTEISLETPVSNEEDAKLIDILSDNSASAESLILKRDLQHKMFKRLSNAAKMVFKWSLLDPYASDTEVCRKSKFSKRKLAYAKTEIAQTYLHLTKRRYKSSYAPYIIYNDRYYNLMDEDGVWLIIQMGLDRRFIHKSRVRVETEMSYRTPMYFPADLVA